MAWPCSSRDSDCSGTDRTPSVAHPLLQLLEPVLNEDDSERFIGSFPPRREDGRGDPPSTLEELYRFRGDRPFKVHPACGSRGWFTEVPHGT